MNSHPTKALAESFKRLMQGSVNEKLKASGYLEIRVDLPSEQCFYHCDISKLYYIRIVSGIIVNNTKYHRWTCWEVILPAPMTS